MGIAVTILFGGVFGAKVSPGEPSGLDVYGLFLMTGILPWTFVAHGVSSSASSIFGNASLVKRVFFRWDVLPLVAVSVAAIAFVIELVVVILVTAAAGSPPTGWYLLYLPLVLIGQFVFIFGIGMAMSAICARSRDVFHGLALILFCWALLSPTGWRDEHIPERPLLGGMLDLRSVLRNNPVAIAINLYRTILYDQRAPELWTIVKLITWAAGSLVVGFAIFMSSRRRVSEAL